MKNRKTFAAALAVILAVSGCGNNNASQTTAATTGTTAAVEATSAADSTTAAPETTAADNGTEADVTTSAAGEAPAEDKGDAILTFYDGSKLYRGDVASATDFGLMTIPFSYMRTSTGTYHDTVSEPDLFDPENFSYDGPTADVGSLSKISVGDTIKGFKVTETEMNLLAPFDSDTGEANVNATEGFTVSSSTVKLEGEIKLTGTMRFHYDEKYAVSSGDIDFIPDSSYAGLPAPCDPTADTPVGTSNFDTSGGTSTDDGYLDEKYNGGICIYTDAPLLHLGNLNTDYAGRSDVSDVVGGTADVSKKVEVTLSELTVNWNDNFGSAYSCKGVIKEIKAI